MEQEQRVDLRGTVGETGPSSITAQYVTEAVIQLRDWVLESVSLEMEHFSSVLRPLPAGPLQIAPPQHNFPAHHPVQQMLQLQQILARDHRAMSRSHNEPMFTFFAANEVQNRKSS